MSPEVNLEDPNRAALLSCLENQREHVLGILEGMTEEQLHTPQLPSGWSPLGLVRQLAIDVEHYWFRCIMAGESLSDLVENGYDGNKAWEAGWTDSADEVFALYRGEIARANDAIALEDAPSQRDDWWGDWDVPDLRFVLLHVIAETACHAGHLGAARELVDGRQYVAL